MFEFELDISCFLRSDRCKYIEVNKKFSYSISCYVYADNLITKISINHPAYENITNLIEYIKEKHNLSDFKRVPPTCNPYWDEYEVKGFDWEAYKTFSAPLIEKERIKDMSEMIGNITSDDLEKIIKYRAENV